MKKKLSALQYSLDTFHRSNQDTSLVHKPTVFEGDWVQPGDLLADCSASEGGELALGHNILVAYMPWEGYNFEDAILISEKLVYDDVFTSIHIERYETETRQTKLGSEKITRELPEVTPDEVKHLDSAGIAKIGSWVEEGDVLVGKITPLPEKVQSPSQKFLYKLLDKKFRPIRDSSLRAPKSIKSKVIKIEVFSSAPIDLNPKSVEREVYPFPERKENKKNTSKLSVIPVRNAPLNYLPDSSVSNKVKNQHNKKKNSHSANNSIHHFLGFVPGYANKMPFTKLSTKVCHLSTKIHQQLYLKRMSLFMCKRLVSGSATTTTPFATATTTLAQPTVGSSGSTENQGTGSRMHTGPEINYISVNSSRSTKLADKLFDRVRNYYTDNRALLPLGTTPVAFTPSEFADGTTPVAFTPSTPSTPSGLGFADGTTTVAFTPSGFADGTTTIGTTTVADGRTTVPVGLEGVIPLPLLPTVSKGLVVIGGWNNPGRALEQPAKKRGKQIPVKSITLPAHATLAQEGKVIDNQVLLANVRPKLGKDRVTAHIDNGLSSRKDKINVSRKNNLLKAISFSKEAIMSSILVRDSQENAHTLKESGAYKKSYIPVKIQIYLAEKRKIQVGDKMAGRHGNKGIISQILPRQDMPYLPDGTAVDIVLNPLGVPSRMNVGQIYECLLGLAGKYLGQHFKIFPFDEIYGPEASRSFVYSKLYEARQKTGLKWLFNPNTPGKLRLFDGRTGDSFEQPITVGRAYMLKLVHMVDDKIHARSTGPYSLVTQQPLRGRSKQGGQRLGEMEVWAIEGYGAAFTLLEMLTIKSDDMTGRMTLWHNLIFNKEISIGTPESFKVLICELQALCLDIGLFKKQ